MARRPASRQSGGEANRIIDAALALAAEQEWDDVRLRDIAARAGVSLSELRALFSNKLDVLAAFSARIDRQVLDALDPDLLDEPARDRLFDVMMGRFDALQPHRAAVHSISRAFTRRPSELMAWNRYAVRSMTWMLEGAGIDASGQFGALRAQGLAWVFGSVLRVWLDDDDPGMARTMVELDRRLRDGENWLRRAAMLCGVLGAVQRVARPRRRGDRGAAEGDREMSPG